MCQGTQALALALCRGSHNLESLSPMEQRGEQSDEHGMDHPSTFAQRLRNAGHFLNQPEVLFW